MDELWELARRQLGLFTWLQAIQLVTEAQLRTLIRRGHVEPSSIRVVTASTEAFRPAAWRVVAGMRFHPAQVHGRPVPVWITIPVSFNFRG